MGSPGDLMGGRGGNPGDLVTGDLIKKECRGDLIKEVT
jgi:hypothetical protein